MNEPTYPVVDVSAWEVLSIEEMGSKPKFWLLDRNAPPGKRWLFKHRHRPSVGDDWAEKVAAEVAGSLELPHATVELAVFQGKPGIISKDLIGSAERRELVLGNNLLVEADPTYPQAHRYHVAEHTIDRVFAAVGADYIGLPESCPTDPAIASPVDLFVGYLLLDALIGNTDRHHENWAVLQLDPNEEGRRAVLCPTFDHASSLGHLLTDIEREKRLATKDQGYTVSAYVRNRKARSALYRTQDDDEPMSMLDAFLEGARRRPVAGNFWKERLRQSDERIMASFVGRIPDEIISEAARRFAIAMLSCNRSRILGETS
jgi:hypothetical protein